MEDMTLGCKEKLKSQGWKSCHGAFVIISSLNLWRYLSVLTLESLNIHKNKLIRRMWCKALGVQMDVETAQMLAVLCVVTCSTHWSVAALTWSCCFQGYDPRHQPMSFNHWQKKLKSPLLCKIPTPQLQLHIENGNFLQRHIFVRQQVFSPSSKRAVSPHANIPVSSNTILPKLCDSSCT